MSQPQQTDFDARLLDLHLGRLDAEQRTALARELEDNPQLASESSAIEQVFSALRGLPVAEPPADLNQRILARVAAAGAPPRVVRTAERSADNGVVLRLHSFRDVIAIAAMVVLAIGIGVPSLLHMKERNQRIMCSANLASIGQGLSAYASAFGGVPTVGWNGHDSWAPTDNPRTQLLPNRRHMYPLLRTRDVAARLMICPSTNDVAMSDQQVPLHNDFPEARNVSYAYQNMAGVRPRFDRDAARLPILGDDNPLFDNGRPLFEVAAETLGLRDPANSNSRAHGGAGQNVLTLDGSVLWKTTPNAGIDGDNIWTLKRIRQYTGAEGPDSAADTHLLK